MRRNLTTFIVTGHYTARPGKETWEHTVQAENAEDAEWLKLTVDTVEKVDKTT